MKSERGRGKYGRAVIEYRVERTARRRTVTLALGADGLVVKVPLAMNADDVRSTVLSRGPWILRRKAEFEDLAPLPMPFEFATGESFGYLGRHFRLNVERADGGPEPAARLNGGFLTVRVAADLDRDGRRAVVQRAVVAWYRRQAARRLPERVARYAARAGLPAPKVLIRGQEKRWGSCSRKGEIRLNWQVVMAPMTLVDYVVAHEVCHLRVPDHSAAFWRLLGTIPPDWEERRERLRTEGARLRRRLTTKSS
ncbi:MAG: M48 family metallopeptidase [Deltaproteobacteria bacterium]|nr:M48 family metallopeptidase [Deltaproteobacteria bacterium]